MHEKLDLELKDSNSTQGAVETLRLIADTNVHGGNYRDAIVAYERALALAGDEVTESSLEAELGLSGAYAASGNKTQGDFHYTKVCNWLDAHPGAAAGVRSRMELAGDPRYHQPKVLR